MGKDFPSRLLRAPRPLQAGRFPRNAPRSPNTPQPDRDSKPLGRFRCKPAPFGRAAHGHCTDLNPRQAQATRRGSGNPQLKGERIAGILAPRAVPPRKDSLTRSFLLLAAGCFPKRCSPPVAPPSATRHRLTSRGKRHALRCKPTPGGRDASGQVASHGPSVAIHQP